MQTLYVKITFGVIYSKKNVKELRSARCSCFFGQENSYWKLTAFNSKLEVV